MVAVSANPSMMKYRVSPADNPTKVEPYDGNEHELTHAVLETMAALSATTR